MRLKQALLACALVAGPVLGQAQLEVASNPLDTGVVMAGETAIATFVLHNPGELPVRILRAAPT